MYALNELVELHKLAEFLSEHPRVEQVYYPGLPSSPYHEVASRLFRKRLYGAVVSFTIHGGLEEVRKIVSRFKVIRPTPSLGATETLATIPSISAARYIDPGTRKKLGITDGLIRLSVGLEDPEDLIEDLDNALNGRYYGVPEKRIKEAKIGAETL